jgi:hypothetical protein
MLLNRRAQTTAEYAIMAAVVVGALALMYGYLRQSAMGRLKGAGDQIGEQLTPGKYDVTYDVTRQETTTTTGVSTSAITKDEVQERKLQE